MISFGGETGVRRLRERASLIGADRVGSTKLCRNRGCRCSCPPQSTSLASCQAALAVACGTVQVWPSRSVRRSPHASAFLSVATQRPCPGRQFLVPGDCTSSVSAMLLLCHSTTLGSHACYRVCAFLSCYHVYCTNYEAMPFPLDPCFLCVHMPIS